MFTSDIVVGHDIDIKDDEEVEEETVECKEDTWSDSGGDQFLTEQTAVSQQPVNIAVSLEASNLAVYGVMAQDAVRPVVPR